MAVLRVAAYARVSTSQQALKIDSSVDTQLEHLQRRAALDPVDPNEPRWHITQEFREEGKSGKDTDRPELQRLLGEIRAGNIDLVAVTKVDRITRSLLDFYRLWDFFEAHGVQFVSLQERFDTTSSIGRAMLKITLVFAELERERTAERTKEKVHTRLLGGKWFGGQVPLGYEPHPKDKTTLVINEEHAAIVRDHIFAKYLELGSIRAVVRHLEKRGIARPTKTSRRGKKRGGTKLGAQAVQNALSNLSYRAQRRHPDDDSLIDCNWPALIDEATFARAQALLAKNAERRPSGRAPRDYVFLLMGLVRCGACGAAMTHSSGTSRTGELHYYYKCSNKHHSANTRCKTRNVPARDLDDFFVGQLRKLTLDEKLLAEAVHAANAGRDAEVATVEEAVRRLGHRLQELKHKEQNVLAAVQDGGGDVKVLVDSLKSLGEQRTVVEDDLLRQKEAQRALRDRVLDVEAVALGFRSLNELLTAAMDQGKREELRALMRAVVDVAVWHEKPDDPNEGWLDIQLFPAAQEILGHKSEQPSEGSLGCPDWLRKGADAGHTRTAFRLPIRSPTKPHKTRALRRCQAQIWLLRAEALQSQMDSEGLSQAAMARRLGLTRARVSQLLAILRLDPKVQETIRNLPVGKPPPGLTAGEVRRLVRLSPQEQLGRLRLNKR